MTTLNPVEKDVMYLAEDYLIFSADDVAQILIWQVDADTRQMIQTMLTFHAEQKALTPDFIIPAEVPFEDPANYQQKLVAWLLSDLKESAEDFDEPLKTWQPNLEEGLENPLLSFLGQMSEILAEYVRHVTLYFRFEHIEDFDAFAGWFLELCHSDIPERVQFAIFDDQNNTITDTLKSLPKGCVMVRNPHIDMNKTMEQTFSASQADESDGPEKGYQTEIVFAVTALRRQDFDTAFHRAQSAFHIAQQNRWWTMQMNALLIYGNAILGKGDLDLAGRSARQALSVWEEAGDEDDRKMLDALKVQACFLNANALMMQKNWADAALAYAAAAEASKIIENGFMEFEGHRMAARCLLEHGEPQKGFTTGMDALTVAKKFPDDLKRNGTLPHLVKDLPPLPKIMVKPFWISA